MRMMFFWTGAGLVVGFVLSVVVAISAERAQFGSPLHLDLLLVIGISIFAVVGAIFGAATVVINESRKIRREITREKDEETPRKGGVPSTQIQSESPR
jgi:hypothetical protein